MLTKADRVRAAIEVCDSLFDAIGKDMRTSSERIEELWFEIDDQITALEEAERRRDDLGVREHLTSMLNLVSKIKDEIEDEE